MNIRLLGDLYQKQLKFELIDERNFFNSRGAIATPSKP